MIYIYIFATIALFILIFATPKIKILSGFVISTSFFDFFPRECNGLKLWDVGVFIIFMGYSHLFFKKKQLKFRDLSGWSVKIFLVYLLFVLSMSILVEQYPIDLTIKASRYFIIGYASYFVFYRLLAIDSEALEFIVNILYAFCYLAVIVHIIQYVTKVQILYGYNRFVDNNDVLRSIPNFIPLVHLFFWNKIGCFVSNNKSSLADFLYIILSIISTLITFTRGIYITFIMQFLLFLFIMIRHKNIILKKMILSIYILLVSLILFGASEGASKITNRFLSGIESIVESSNRIDKNKNTYSLRIQLLKERVAMVLEHNVLIGYGFIHEDVAANRLKWRIGTYNEKSKNGIAFASDDISWVDYLVYTGFVGVFLFIMMIYVLNKNAYSILSNDSRSNFIWITSLIVQINGQVLLMISSNSFATNRILLSIILVAMLSYCSSVAKGKLVENKNV